MNRIVGILSILIAVILALPNFCFSDGKFYYQEEIPVDIPYQRAVLGFDGQQEVLVLQSKYDLKDAKVMTDFGWVVPIPAIPQLAGMNSVCWEVNFPLLNSITRPKVIPISKYFDYAFCIGVSMILGYVLVVILSIPFVLFGGKRFGRKKHPKIWTAVWLLISIGIACLAIPNLISMGDRGSEDVDIIHEEQIGIYDIQVITAGQGSNLYLWLNDNGFHFSQADTIVFNDYLDRKWCFAVAKITPTAIQKKQQFYSRGLTDPLILKFKTDRAVYPLALTATTGQPTEVVLYTFSAHKMECENRLQLQYASTAERGSRSWQLLDDCIIPMDFADDFTFDQIYLSRFRGRLTSEEMRNDLYLSYAKNDKPYRKRIYR